MSISAPGSRRDALRRPQSGAVQLRAGAREEETAKDFLIESDIIIDFLEGAEGARSALESAADEGVLRLSAVSAAQVMAASKEAARETTGGLLDSFGIVPVDKEVALLAGHLLSAGAGDGLELDDCIVAASCHELGAVLVTRGQRKYPPPDIEVRVARY